MSSVYGEDGRANHLQQSGSCQTHKAVCCDYDPDEGHHLVSQARPALYLTLTSHHVNWWVIAIFLKRKFKQELEWNGTQEWNRKGQSPMSRALCFCKPWTGLLKVLVMLRCDVKVGFM